MSSFSSEKTANGSKRIMFCPYCGAKLDDHARYCKNCGEAIEDKKQEDRNSGQETYYENPAERKTVYEGDIHKCPNCGEVLKSFELNCPACGYELRGAKTSSAVKEFALKLEAIESKREYEKPRGIWAAAEAQQRVSKTDEQKISLIKSFSVPNTKEDMLEFMILATSSMNMRTYDSANTNVSKSEKEVTAAWFSKVQQVYEKAKRTYSTDSMFMEIKALYDSCNEEIKKSKKKGIIKWGLMFGWMPVFLAVIFIWIGIYSPISEKKEVARLESIVAEIESQLEKGEYKYALMNADTLVYSGTIRNEEQERQWIVKREYWIDKIIEEAANNGVILERPADDEKDDVNTTESTGGFIDGFKEGVQPGLDAAQENIDEFNHIVNGEEPDGSGAIE